MEQARRKFPYQLIIIGLALSLANCKSRSRVSDASDIAAADQMGAGILAARPWEIRTEHLETVVPDIFYADASQNAQIIPTLAMIKKSSGNSPGDTVEYKIDHMIYPTIGNPNLFVNPQLLLQPTALNPDPTKPFGPGDLGIPDSFLTVLRLEKEFVGAITQTGTYYMPGGQNDAKNEFVTFANQNNIRITLIPTNQNRSAARACTESTEPVGNCSGIAVSIAPSSIVRQDPNGLPASLADRETFTFKYDLKAMASVREGLYDVRFEIFEGQQLKAFEFQYNALRVFKESPADFQALNITDTQMSMSTKLDKFQELTVGPTEQIVKNINLAFADDPKVGDADMRKRVRSASFITFNGDLHNSGSPLTITAEDVATTYLREAEKIVTVLRGLSLPIFLTIGNHDGYASTGHAPDLEDSALQNIVQKIAPNMVDRWQSYKDHTAKQLGGIHRDVVVGTFTKRFASYDQSGAVQKNWHEIPEGERNVMLYDGFHQWRRTYGPLYSSWKFGQSYFLNVNTFDLRQHRRTGWGMYTVNYGGGISPFQQGWINRETEPAKLGNRDLVIIGHHDPRGGHNGHDYPYYFKQVDYSGMSTSIGNYVQGEIFNPKLCKYLPEWIKTKNKKLSCLHDGLQEWMRPDEDFDCEDNLLKDSGEPDWNRTCDESKVNKTRFAHLNYSGYVFINKIAKIENLRTILLGHTHYSSLEVYQPGSFFAPMKVVLDAESAAQYKENPNSLANVEFYQNPARLFAEKMTETQPLPPSIQEDTNGFLTLFLRNAGHSFKTQLNNHEVVVLRLTSSSNLSSQTYNGQDFYGYSVLEFNGGGGAPARLNKVFPYHFVPHGSGSPATFDPVPPVTISRSTDIRYRRLEDIKKEFPEDAAYLAGKGYKDQANPFRTDPYKLKTEPSDN